jgi:hypothetical protein
MRSRNKSKAESFKVGGVVIIAKMSPYVQRVIQDPRVRDTGRLVRLAEACSTVGWVKPA